MSEHSKRGEFAVLVQIDVGMKNAVDELREFQELAVSAGAQPVSSILGARRVPEAKYFVGIGKAEEIRAAVIAHKATLVLFNHALTPAQERNLERLLQVRVLDRTGLILAIFAHRARTFEGKLQVELAQLQHLATRLVRGWSHLERQKGGIGLRGPGETQLETDRRLIRIRIKTIQQRLAKVRQQRTQSRRARIRAGLPLVSLVGYTNAGKSTLFNKLTGAQVYAADQLFATLDPTLRRVYLAPQRFMILADTVGFIRHLPHDLIAAFRATLEETLQASLLLHIVDATDAAVELHNDQVLQTLKEIGAEQIPILTVYNKIDAMPALCPQLERDHAGRAARLWLSAKTGAGIALLLQTLDELLYENHEGMTNGLE